MLTVISVDVSIVTPLCYAQWEKSTHTYTHTLKKTIAQYIGYLFLVFVDVLATSKVISRLALTCDSAPSLRLYSAVPLGDQTVSAMT